MKINYPHNRNRRSHVDVFYTSSVHILSSNNFYLVSFIRNQKYMHQSCLMISHKSCLQCTLFHLTNIEEVWHVLFINVLLFVHPHSLRKRSKWIHHHLSVRSSDLNTINYTGLVRIEHYQGCPMGALVETCDPLCTMLKHYHHWGGGHTVLCTYTDIKILWRARFTLPY